MRPIPIAMTSALARLFDLTPLPRVLGGRSVRAAIDAGPPQASRGAVPADRDSRRRRPGQPRPAASDPNPGPEYEQRIRNSMWQLLWATWLVLGGVIVSVYLATGHAPLPAAGPSRTLYLPVIAAGAVCNANACCGAAIAGGRFPRRLAVANAIWSVVALLFFGIMFLAYLA